MFRIGQSLQDARIARGLELADVEQRTLIRRKYLGALEAERFDVLPGDAYARAFVREYAEFLGLDPQPFLDQLAVQQDEAEPIPFTPPPPLPRRRSSVRPLLVLAALAVAATVGVLAWKVGGGSSPHLPLAQPETHPVPTQAAAAPRKRSAPRQAVPPPASTPAGPHLLLTAARGPVWLLVRVRSRQGETLYEDILRRGHSIRFGRRDLWIRIGAPPSLDIRVDGRRITLPPSSRPQNVVVAAQGGLRQA
ncbi:MAG TPA: helix-turn-helix domain-containing protein [Gaiellaceae bacterium]|nr:helix-turn-helix domain-containing protein [Gaiellaceae bacterium]